ncbi:hypothetical protein [Kushneria konosiri]|uniref:Uncharacterized protein n=1 Tax=Kushneria konosiri TaxID=698828 RepID=A0A2Z2HE31_9GAMM|nr:hypothetical protein [Kushneria konosiri]ARS51531.1 hypothetical protein B9G99_00290 [Kushneria konosiri]
MDLENQSLDEKKCVACGETWPDDRTFFIINRGQTTNTCKACYYDYPSVLRRSEQGKRILEERTSQRVAASCHPATFVLMRDYAKRQQGKHS